MGSQVYHTTCDRHAHRPRKVLVQFEDMRKAFAKFSPRVGACDYPGATREKNSTLKVLARSR
jgi:hypothetical protein